eukprot:scaffold42432_cov277-Skeletonema_marinoi.AAC.1
MPNKARSSPKTLNEINKSVIKEVVWLLIKDAYLTTYCTAACRRRPPRPTYHHATACTAQGCGVHTCSDHGRHSA